jgi:YlmC/YmxH family sporulation protein
VFLSEMQKKDIIDLETGANLGKMTDAEVDENGQIIRFTAEPKRFFRRLFKSYESTVNYKNIVKIGADVILVKNDNIS